MNIVEFFEHSEGKWFSQCTRQDLTLKQSKAGKTDVFISVLPSADPEVIRLCQSCAVDPGLALCGVQARWERSDLSTGGSGSQSTLLVPVADSLLAKEGQLLRSMLPSAEPFLGRYRLEEDGALTLLSETPERVLEERLWYITPNLRLRTNLLREGEGLPVTTFFSEIRMGGGRSPQ